MERSKIIGLIGIGIFICLTLQGISSFSSKICGDALLLMNLESIFVEAISEYLSLAFIILIFLWIVRMLKAIELNNLLTIRKVLLIAVFCFFLTQVLGFSQVWIESLYESDEFITRSLTYHKWLRVHGYWNIGINISAWIIKYSVITLLIISEINKSNFQTNFDDNTKSKTA